LIKNQVKLNEQKQVDDPDQRLLAYQTREKSLQAELEAYKAVMEAQRQEIEQLKLKFEIHRGEKRSGFWCMQEEPLLADSAKKFKTDRVVEASSADEWMSDLLLDSLAATLVDGCLNELVMENACMMGSESTKESSYHEPERSEAVMPMTEEFKTLMDVDVPLEIPWMDMTLSIDQVAMDLDTKPLDNACDRSAACKNEQGCQTDKSVTFQEACTLTEVCEKKTVETQTEEHIEMERTAVVDVMMQPMLRTRRHQTEFYEVKVRILKKFMNE